jgi:hypothetical protein
MLMRHAFEEAGLLAEIFTMLEPKNCMGQAERFQRQRQHMIAQLDRGAVVAVDPALANVGKRRRPPAGAPALLDAPRANAPASSAAPMPPALEE